MAFNLDLYPVIYLAQYNPATKNWEEKWIETDNITYSELCSMAPEKKAEILAKRNLFGLPCVSYTSQYGYGCFEGMKAFSTKDGGISIFRPDRNAARFASSMKGLKCPVFPEEMYVKASEEFIKRNAKLGYIPEYDPEWEKDEFASASSVYMRPFMNSEGAIGVGCSTAPTVVICATTVSSYFKGGNTKAVTTKRVRATPYGTGCIKCASNYVISALAKKEAEEAAAKATKEGTVAEKKKDAIMASIAPRNFAAAKITAHKKVVDGGWFIKQRRIPLFFPDTFIDDVGVEHETVQGVLPDGNMKLPIYTRPLRIDTAPYPRVALAASEYLPSGTEAYFTICLMNPADKEAMLECLDFKEYVGMLQWRGGGKGTLVWTPATKDGVPVDDIP